MTEIKYLLSLIIVIVIFPLHSIANTKYKSIRNPFTYGQYEQLKTKHSSKENKNVVIEQYKKTTRSQLRLNGIIQTKYGFIALINQNSVSTGDTIYGWTVIAISKNSVHLKKGNYNKTLKI